MNSWRQVQRENITSLETLCSFLELNDAQAKCLIKSSFPLNLPIRLANKIEKRNLDDPILRQFVPLKEEKEIHGDYTLDPVGDLHALRTPKSIKKYTARLLLLPTSACAMHCRFCFRRHFPYDTTYTDLQKEFLLIDKDKTLREIILSGGDPLSLSDEKLREIINRLSTFSHLKRLRIHTRFPIGIPERIDPFFLSIMQQCKLQVWFVIHCNHPRELDDQVLDSLKKIQRLGIPVLNQTVLLKGVNDTIETLETLCTALIDAGIVPYYLHQLDRVQGSAHFSVSEKIGNELITNLRRRLPGYGVPDYVKEEPGKESKTPVYSATIEAH